MRSNIYQRIALDIARGALTAIAGLKIAKPPDINRLSLSERILNDIKEGIDHDRYFGFSTVCLSVNLVD